MLFPPPGDLLAPGIELIASEPQGKPTSNTTPIQTVAIQRKVVAREGQGEGEEIT